jgi:hypothetical protein
MLKDRITTAGDIRIADGELHITLAPLSSPHRTHAAKVLCEILDQTATLFPGSRLIPLPGPLESKSGMGFPAGREGLVVES